ncbi:MAG: choice-of-anchor L domain-containing protein [Saprospiraceae bacterium]|nr:choice-of-anchor L domain-containing protein [Saprospiraceae bacterium]
MKVVFSVMVAMFMAATLCSQAPINDAFDCATMIDFGVAPSCSPAVYTNVNATPSIIATVDTVSCFNSATAQRDVWFKFTCSDTLFDYRITIKAAGIDPIVNPEIAIYRGDCQFNGLGEIGCVSAQVGEDSLFIDLFNLTPNELYYIRVSDWSATAAPNSGEFTLCVEEIPPILTIDQGGSSLCSGTLYDSGGANGDYGNNEDYTFVICPDQPSECIAFTLEYYNLEPSLPAQAGQGDELNFYDGPTTNSPLLASLDGNGFQPEYVAGGGGVCFQVKAQSGCITVEFISDATVQESGWKGTWTCSSDPCPAPQQIQIDTAAAALDIEGAVSTGGAMVTVTSINCPQGGLGTFTYPSDNNDLQLEKGLLLTSGQALNALGPNDFGGLGTQNDPLFADDPGDADLQYLSDAFGGGSTTYDVCSVELDVFAGTNEVVFEYVFGSEEYPEFVWSTGGYNDIFAFLVSGPGIVGDPLLTNSALNIATLPTTGTLVQIDSVNNQVNWQYYRNNEISQSLQYDGLTSDFLGVKKSLTARVPVTPCNTYHLKLAIADRGDESFDSGVFVSEIKAGSPDIEIAFSSGVDYFIESCTGDDDTLFITLNKIPTVETSFNITLGGTATPGIDYLLNIPPTITFQPGQQTLAFPIIPIADNFSEGSETILISLSRDYGCGEVTLKTLSVDLFDNVEVNVQGGDTLTVCIGDFLQLNASGASNYVWEPEGEVSNPYIPNPFTSPAQSMWLVVTGSVGSCIDQDSVFVRVIAPTISATALTATTICIGGTVELQAMSSESSVVWSPAAGLDDPNSFTPIASPTFPVTYTVSATLEGCTVEDFVTIVVDTLFFPDVIDDLIQCQNFPVQLAPTLNSTTQYEWTPATGLNNPNIAGPIALPDVSTQYILTATSANGACSQTDTVNLTITPADVDILGEDSLYLCLGMSEVLTTNVNPAGSTVFWTPTGFLSASAGPSVVVTPTETVTIVASYEINGCPPVLDSVYIKVDSLPDLGIFLSPEKPFYCPGDTVYMLSNTYEPANFPGIQHMWTPFGNQLTPLEKWNMIIVTSDSFTYKRTTWIGGCLDTATVFVPVPQPPDLPYTVTPNPICPGESAQIVVTPNPLNTTLEWEESTATTLSCDDCPAPLATPLSTTTYHVTTPDAQCPSGADITVEVKPLPQLALAENPSSCQGAPVVLNGTNEQGVTYSWSPSTYLDNPNIGNPTATPTQADIVTYVVQAEKDGCKVEGLVVLTAYFATIEITTPPQSLCAGDQLTLTTNTTGTPGTIGWLPAGPEITPTSTDTYKATLFFGDGCTVQDSVEIVVQPLPTISLKDTVVCAGNGVMLGGSPQPGVVYLWSPATGLSNPNIYNPIATPGTATTYTLIATNSTGNCQVDGQVSVGVADATVSAGQDQDICAGETVSLTATINGTTGGTFGWTNGQAAATIIVMPTTDHTYTVSYMYGPNESCLATDVVTVFVDSVPVLDVIQAPIDSVCAGATVVLKTKIKKGAGTLTWFENGVAIPGAAIDSITVTPQGGASVYSVMVTGANGCTGTAQPVTVLTRKCFDVPNAFTPNGDDANDLFGPIFFDGAAEVVEFNIYNRWGQKVFTGSDTSRNWDGKVDGKNAPSDVYVYQIRVRFANGDEENKAGEVNLIR